MSTKLALASLLFSVVRGQQAGTLTTETHPPLTWQTCTAPGVCTTIQGKVVLDSNWRWLHSTSGSTNCYTGNTWNAALCPSDVACAANCALDGADYTGVYGVTASGSSLRLNFVTTGANKNVGSRLYLMADDTHYKTFNLLNQEFTFDVDVSHLPCGLNGALYMVNMDADGGMARFPGNKAGAKYGTGYCDTQCPRDLKFINGEANVEGWIPSSNSVNSGVGNYGTCCAEMDIWEANSMSAALTPHSSDTVTQTRCTGNACGGAYSTDRYSGTTDPDGCDFNSYRQGDTSFYGPGKKVDTNSVFTVVTQFLTDTGTASGTMNEIKRFYVQNGVIIPNSVSTIAGISGNSINAQYCAAQKSVFGDTNAYSQHGGFASMSAAMKSGMTLVLSIWDDYDVNMLWLDATYPVGSSKLGAARGPCSATSGVPAEIEVSAANSYVIYSNIKVGAINSTFSGNLAPVSSSASSATTLKTSTSTKASTSTSSTKVSTSSAAAGTGAAVPRWGQCGGVNFGATQACVSPYTCQCSSIYYCQCL